MKLSDCLDSPGLYYESSRNAVILVDDRGRAIFVASSSQNYQNIIAPTHYEVTPIDDFSVSFSITKTLQMQVKS